MQDPITWAQVRENPALATTTRQLPNGETVTLRLVTVDDAAVLGSYFLSLSDETRRRYGPHPFDQATADRLCAEAPQSNYLRMLGTIQTGGQEQVIGYVILVIGVLDFDVEHYNGYGIPLNPETDTTLAPSVADAYQNRGLGSVIIRHVFDVARRMGRKRCVLWGGTQATNDRAIHVYHKLGFRDVGTFELPPGKYNYDMILEL
jgi:diamine N-acetyltransferase